MIPEALFLASLYLVLGYFTAANLLQSLWGALGLRSLVLGRLSATAVPAEDVRRLGVWLPVSFLVPARADTTALTAAVRDLLALDYPDFEVIVVVSGDAPLLAEAFGLVEEARVYRRVLKTAPVRTLLRSVVEPRLTVVQKDDAGRGDALNAALNVAAFPVVCATDSRSVVDAAALLGATRALAEDAAVAAVASTVRPANGLVRGAGEVALHRLPKSWLARLQIVEHARAAFASRAGLTGLRALVNVAGSCALVRTGALLAAGGWPADAPLGDAEVSLRLLRKLASSGRKWSVRLWPGPLARRAVPERWSELFVRRARWHRGLVQALWVHRDLALRSRHGALGVVAVPYLWIFEGLAPAVELAGYALVVATWATRTVYPEYALEFFLLVVFFGVLVSQVALGVETLLGAQYQGVAAPVVLLLCALADFVLYRQLLALARLGGAAWALVPRKRTPAP